MGSAYYMWLAVGGLASIAGVGVDGIHQHPPDCASLPGRQGAQSLETGDRDPSRQLRVPRGRFAVEAGGGPTGTSSTAALHTTESDPSSMNGLTSWDGR